MPGFDRSGCRIERLMGDITIGNCNYRFATLDWFGLCDLSAYLWHLKNVRMQGFMTPITTTKVASFHTIAASFIIAAVTLFFLLFIISTILVC